MKKLVSFFGERSELFEKLNEKTAYYAKEKNIEYVWRPQIPYDVNSVIQELRNADAGLIDIEPYNEAIFRKLNDRCKLLVRFGVGFDKVDLDAATRYGICVTRTTGANKTGVAEMALTMILAARRQLMIHRKVMESGIWEKNIGYELLGKRIGILGYGNIGRALAGLLEGFQCDILAYDTHCEDGMQAKNVRFADLDEIFETCDAISVHLPYCPETHHLVNAERIAKMKAHAVLVCTARGNIIDEEALYEALKDHRIGGAGLDVYSQEPLSAESRLLSLDNIVLTPHVSSQTYESIWNTYKKAIDIAADFFEGKELNGADLLNPDYRKCKR